MGLYDWKFSSACYIIIIEIYSSLHIKIAICLFLLWHIIVSIFVLLLELSDFFLKDLSKDTVGILTFNDVMDWLQV